MASWMMSVRQPIVGLKSSPQIDSMQQRIRSPSSRLSQTSRMRTGGIAWPVKLPSSSTPVQPGPMSPNS